MYPMGKMIKRAFFCSVCAVVCALFIPGVGFAAEDDYVAALYTHENYQGVEWKISEEGMYDLREGFNIPNDIICSIKVRPGYTLTLFEHAGFKGKSQTWSEDAPSLAGFWNRQASSLEVQDRGDKWKASFVRRNPLRTGVFLHDLDAEKAKELEYFTKMYEPHWYGKTTDDERIMMAGILLRLYDALGYNVSEWTPNTFARQMNNFFDWRKDLSVWRVACLIQNVAPEAYE